MRIGGQSGSEGPEALAAAIGQAASGDRSALRTIFQRTSAKLFGICLRILKDREEAEDVLQEVYVTVWSRAGSFDPAKAGAITWLATIARNRAIDRLRALRSRGGGAPIEEAVDIADDRPDAFAAAAANDESRRLHSCIGELEERTRGVIRIAFFEGLSYADLAARAAVPLGTMKSWIRRGLQRLRTCLER